MVSFDEKKNMGLQINLIPKDNMKSSKTNSNVAINQSLNIWTPFQMRCQIKNALMSNLKFV